MSMTSLKTLHVLHSLVKMGLIHNDNSYNAVHFLLLLTFNNFIAVGYVTIVCLMKVCYTRNKGGFPMD